MHNCVATKTVTYHVCKIAHVCKNGLCCVVGCWYDSGFGHIEVSVQIQLIPLFDWGIDGDSAFDLFSD
jgi:hypothetical protein